MPLTQFSPLRKVARAVWPFQLKLKAGEITAIARVEASRAACPLHAVRPHADPLSQLHAVRLVSPPSAEQSCSVQIHPERHHGLEPDCLQH